MLNDNLSEAVQGSPPADDGRLLLTIEERKELLEKYPELKEVIQPFTIKRRGSGSFTNYKQLRETQSSAFL